MVEGEGESFSSRVMRSHTGHLSDAFSYRLSDLTGTGKKAGRGLTAASKRRAELGVPWAFAAESWKLYSRLRDSELEALDTKP